MNWPAVLFVGVDYDGVPQQGVEKLQELATSVEAVLAQAYPRIYFDSRYLGDGSLFGRGNSW